MFTYICIFVLSVLFVSFAMGIMILLLSGNPSGFLGRLWNASSSHETGIGRLFGKGLSCLWIISPRSKVGNPLISASAWESCESFPR